IKELFVLRGFLDPLGIFVVIKTIETPTLLEIVLENSKMFRGFAHQRAPRRMACEDQLAKGEVRGCVLGNRFLEPTNSIQDIFKVGLTPRPRSQLTQIE